MLYIFNQDILVLNLIYRYIYKNHFTKFLQTRTLQFEMMYYRYKSCIKSVYVNNFIFYTNVEAVNTIPSLILLNSLNKQQGEKQMQIKDISQLSLILI